MRTGIHYADDYAGQGQYQAGNSKGKIRVGWTLGLAFRHRPDRRGVPDIDGFLRHIAPSIGLDPARRPDATRAGLIPCGGPVVPLSAPRAILTGDAAGIVSPLTAGGIHAGSSAGG